MPAVRDNRALAGLSNRHEWVQRSNRTSPIGLAQVVTAQFSELQLGRVTAFSTAIFKIADTDLELELEFALLRRCCVVTSPP